MGVFDDGPARESDFYWDNTDFSRRLRYSMAGKKGAESLGLKGAAETEAVEKSGADRQIVRFSKSLKNGKEKSVDLEEIPERAEKYSYAALTSLPNMRLATFKSAAFPQKATLKDMISAARRSVLEVGGQNTARGLALDIPALGKSVIIGRPGIKHGLRPYGNYKEVYAKENADILPVLGELLKNAIPVNELKPREKDPLIVRNTVLVSACQDERGNIIPVVGIVQHAKDTNYKPAVYVYPLKGINTNGRNPNAFDTHTGLSGHTIVSLANLIEKVKEQIPVFTKDVYAYFNENRPESDYKGLRYSRSSIFTGAAADYANRSRQGGVDDGPSVKKIGTGEGSQVYGWGLRGTTIRKNAERDSFGKRQKNLYKQTFFTNRAPGDESHLLDWNGTTTLEQKQWFADEANKEFGGNWIATERGLREGDGPRFDDDKGWKLYNIAKMLVARNKYTAGRVEQLASEFLYRAGIDGVKAPDIRYGKTSDKDELGNIYVAFSDEHIRVDHKWTDGQMRYSRSVRPSAPGGRHAEVL